MTKLKMELETGDVVIETFDDLAPKHVEQITRLAEDGFYDGLTFHRVIDGFMAQGGCPQGSGMGGADDNIPAEFNDTPHVEGIVLHGSGAGSKLSIKPILSSVIDDATFLDNQYTAWGKRS